MLIISVYFDRIDADGEILLDIPRKIHFFGDAGVIHDLAERIVFLVVVRENVCPVFDERLSVGFDDAEVYLFFAVRHQRVSGDDELYFDAFDFVARKGVFPAFVEGFDLQVDGFEAGSLIHFFVEIFVVFLEPVGRLRRFPVAVESFVTFGLQLLVLAAEGVDLRVVEANALPQGFQLELQRVQRR